MIALQMRDRASWSNYHFAQTAITQSLQRQYLPPLAIFLYFVYRILFRRPGRLPPGPKQWPVVGNLPNMGTMPHQNLAAMAHTYGPLVYLRLGFVDVVVAMSASVAAQFLKIHDANFSSRPPNSGAKHVAYNYQDLVFAPYGPRWRLFKKITPLHIFSTKALDDFTSVRQEEVGTLVGTLARCEGGAANLGQLLNIWATNALGRVMFGKKVFEDGTSDVDPKADEFKSMVVELMVLAGVFNVGDFIPALDCLDLQGVAAKMKKLHKRFDSFLADIIRDHRLNSSRNQHCFLSTLISDTSEVEGDGSQLTDTEIKALLLNMFTAGNDTTSSTVEWAIAELIRHPKILAKAQQEMYEVDRLEQAVMESDLSKPTYLQAVVKETFRLHSSTTLSLPRIAADSCEINGYHIPKGATLLVNVCSIARDPEVWAEPLAFRPERFLPGGEKEGVDVKGNNFELIPFGAGRRICAGMSLGLRMVQLLTATLVQAFDWELPKGALPEALNMDEAYGLTLQRASPLLVHPQPRLPKHPYAHLSS